MKKIIGLLVILIIGFTSCEGRKTSNQALTESIKEFKKNASFEVDVYIPENYVEREVDTLLSNGYRVKIKTYTDESQNVLFTKIKDTINYQTYYRNFKFDISVLKNDKLIYSESFDKPKVNKVLNYNANLTSESDLYNFDKLGVLKSIQVNDDPSYTNMVVIDLLYTIPESNRYASHVLFIDKKGKSNFVKVEAN